MDIITAKLGAKMAQEELQANGQVGYIKSVNAVLMPEASYAFASGAAMLPVSVAFTEGDRVTTTLDGVEYSATAKSATMPDGTNGAAAGNLGMLGGEDTGEPFFAFCGMMEGALIVALFVLADAGTESSQHTASISAEVNEVHAIDPKYLYSYFRFENYGQTYPELGEAVSIDKETWQAMTDFLRVPGVIICQDGSVPDASGGLFFALSDRNTVVAVRDSFMDGVTYVQFRTASANSNYMLEFKYDGTTYSYTLRQLS